MVDREQRKLRSQEATRYKSDLMAYFPEYDEIIGNTEPSSDPLASSNTEISIHATNEDYASIAEYIQRTQTPVSFTDETFANVINTLSLTPTPELSPVRAPKRPLSTRTMRTRAPRAAKSITVVDPLDDSLFVEAHARCEKLEKAARTTERTRVRAEQQKIVGLLTQLRSEDAWARALGVHGALGANGSANQTSSSFVPIATTTPAFSTLSSTGHPGSKRNFDDARQYFIKGCENLLAKFRYWDEEERALEEVEAFWNADGHHAHEEHRTIRVVVDSTSQGTYRGNTGAVTVVDKSRTEKKPLAKQTEQMVPSSAPTKKQYQHQQRQRQRLRQRNRSQRQISSRNQASRAIKTRHASEYDIIEAGIDCDHSDDLASENRADDPGHHPFRASQHNSDEDQNIDYSELDHEVSAEKQLEREVRAFLLHSPSSSPKKSLLTPSSRPGKRHRQMPSDAADLVTDLPHSAHSSTLSSSASLEGEHNSHTDLTVADRGDQHGDSRAGDATSTELDPSTALSPSDSSGPQQKRRRSGRQRRPTVLY